MSRNLWSSPKSQPSPTKDLYWFAHAADPPVERPRGLWNREQSKEELSSDGQPASPQKTDPETEGQDLESSNEAVNVIPSNVGKAGSPVRPDGKEIASLSVKEREERARLVRERQEEERLRRLMELQQASEQAQRFREQQEEERRRKIEEMRLRDIERRQAVEERKRQIWEAELERKEAILRRNVERESKLEARRNAQRNSLCFAFGSSTPRTSSGRPGGVRECSPVESNNYHPPEKEGSPLLWAAQSSAQVAQASKWHQGVAADNHSVQDRLVDARCSPGAAASSRHTVDHIRDCLTDHIVSDVDSDANTKRESPQRGHSKQTTGWLTGAGAVVGEDIMSRSVGSLSSFSRGRRKTDLMPVMPRERDIAPLRPATASRKEPAHSPTRPRSSMSAASEQSAASSMASTVSLRPRTGPKRPRPISIAGTAPDHHRPAANSQASAGEPRQSRPMERKPVPSSRAKSVGAERPRRMDVAPSSTGKPVPPPKPTPPAAAVPRVSRREHKPKPKMAAEPGEHEGTPPTSQDSAAEQQGQPSQVNGATDTSEPPSTATETSTSTSAPVKPRIVSEEEARAALAEKRRLAREQAEREAREREAAELERQRQEQLRQAEEEEARKRKMEEMEKKAQEEQRAKEEAAALEKEQQEQQEAKEAEAEVELTAEEKEQKAKEEAERLAKEEEERAAKEEQERKAREEAEKQRKELEERLKREEAERAERKKRVEEIMSRTRGRNKQFSPKHEPVSSSTTTAPAAAEEKVEPVVKPDVIPAAHDEQLKRPAEGDAAGMTAAVVSGEGGDSKPEAPLQLHQQPCLLGDSGLVPTTGGTAGGKQDRGSTVMDLLMMQPADGGDASQLGDGDVMSAKTQLGHGPEVIPASEKTAMMAAAAGKADSALPYDSNKGQIANGVSETNGYSSHDEDVSSMSETSPEEKLKDPVDIISNLATTTIPLQPTAPSQQPSYEFEQLIDISDSTTTTSQAMAVDNLNNAGDINSNRVPGAPFIAFEDNTSISRKQEASITDLLS